MRLRRKFETDKKSQRIRITNSIDAPATLFIEPWGRDYTLLPGETFELVMEGASDDSLFDIYHFEKTIEVYPQGHCLDILVLQNEKELQCGHNRQSG
jgi:hypothetical protein